MVIDLNSYMFSADIMFTELHSTAADKSNDNVSTTPNFSFIKPWTPGLTPLTRSELLLFVNTKDIYLYMVNPWKWLVR